MANTKSIYWQDVDSEMAKIEKIIAGSAFQSKECVFISAREKRGADPDFNAGAGRISAAPLKLAACRLVDGTHEIASDAAVEKYLAEQEQKRKEMGFAAKTSITFAQPREVKP